MVSPRRMSGRHVNRTSIAWNFQKMPVLLAAFLVLGMSVVPSDVRATPEDALQSVVSVLPVWPGRPQGGSGQSSGVAPEGSGVVVRPGVIATAWHVVEPAERIDVRLADGRVLPARLVGQDVASDIAVLAIEAAVPVFEIGPAPALASPACSIGNAYGLGLSVTCGVVSTLQVSDAGFNPVEDFVQTDAAANPGVSGGALVDESGRLIGMMSAVFASGADTNIGINFAVSSDLLMRVTEAILTDGQVTYVEAGWQLQRASRDQLTRLAAPVVAGLAPDGAAARAGVRAGDQVVRIGDRRIRTPRDAIGALALVAPSDPPVPVLLSRDGAERTVELAFAAVEAPGPQASVPQASIPQATDGVGDCPHPAEVCTARQAVFPVSAFDPVASATRVGADLLVTNRHAVADHEMAVVHTPDGPREARVVASDYPGDLAVLEVDGLPAEGLVFSLEGAAAARGAPVGDLFAVGADVARQQIRVFAPGQALLGPAPGAELGRLHVTSSMQPGVSGGALVDGAGRLVGIAVGGGDGRFEAIPLEQVSALLAGREGPEAEEIHRTLGAALADCVEAVEAVQGGQAAAALVEAVASSCAASGNQGQLLAAGRVAARSGVFERAIELHASAVAQTPNSINARLSLLVSLQLGGRFEEMVPHARWLLEAAPDDSGALRFGVQSGVWGGDPELAEAAYQALLSADPRQAEAARRFIDNAPPAPPRR